MIATHPSGRPPACAPGIDSSGGWPRILLYSHDSWGLGHLRRSLTLGSALAGAFPQASILLATGSPCATHFPVTPRVGVVKLPSVTKDGSGVYVPRDLGGNLEFTVGLRRRLLLEAFRAFAPHLVLVDHKVVGLGGEVLPILEEAKECAIPTILGLRDVVDAPEAVARRWSSPEHRWALAEGYDRICVYGCPEVFDPRAEYASLSRLGSLVEFTGYVVRPCTLGPAHGGRPRVLVTTGGGEDGIERVETYLTALSLAPARWSSTVVTGPMMDPRQVKRLKRVAGRLGVKLYSFHADLPRLLSQASAVVSMAGYNSAAEALQRGAPTIFLPRLFPRQEQRLRARSFARLGLARSLEELDPRTLRLLVEEALAGTLVAPGPALSLRGTDRLCEIVAELLDAARSSDGHRRSDLR